MKKLLKKVVRKFFNFFSRKLKESRWYQFNCGDLVKMKNWNEFNLDLITLGSSAVKFGLDYSGYKIKAANWAMAPQDFNASFAILKNYHSFAKENGCLCLCLCPFQFLSDRRVPNRDNIEYWNKYHYFLSPVLIPHYSERVLQEIRNTVENPLLTAPLGVSIGALKARLSGKDKSQYPNAKIDAQNRIENWKKQFSIKDFSDSLSEENLKAIKYNTDIICEMAEFCKERSLVPVFGIAPATKILKDQIPGEFMQKAFFDAVEKVKERTEVLFLDYYRSSEFESDDLYLDSFLLNEKGKNLFTERVLKDLGFSTERK